MPDPNPFTEDADQTGELFDITRPSTTRVIAPPPPPAAVAPVAAAPAAPPPVRSITAPSPMDVQLQSMRGQFSNLPMAQANEAVSTALKFQATRGYQNDLQNGMAPAEALAKWAPMMFTAPKSSNLGQAASFIRATRPPIQKPVNVGGTLYNLEPGGQSVSVTPGQRVAAPKTSDFDKAQYTALIKEASALEKELDAEPSGKAADDLRSKLQFKRQQMKDIEGRYSRPAPMGAPAPAAAATVVRRTKEGRRAVFDATTRKFIRYAD